MKRQHVVLVDCMDLDCNVLSLISKCVQSQFELYENI